MKEHINYRGNAIRKSILLFSLTGILLLNAMALPIYAQEKETVPTPVMIQYLGTLDHQPVFQIEFENMAGQTFNISIKDDEGNTLYTEKVKDKKFSKKFKLESEDLDNFKLVFTLYGAKEKQTQVFEISNNLRMIQDVVVTKL